MSSKKHENLIKISNKMKFGQDIPNGVSYHQKKPHESDTGYVLNVAKIQNGGHHNRQNFNFVYFGWEIAHLVDNLMLNRFKLKLGPEMHRNKIVSQIKNIITIFRNIIINVMKQIKGTVALFKTFRSCMDSHLISKVDQENMSNTFLSLSSSLSVSLASSTSSNSWIIKRQPLV